MNIHLQATITTSSESWWIRAIWALRLIVILTQAIVNSRSDQQGVIGYAYKEGEADIVMSVVIIYPEPYTREIKDFSLRQSIKVVDPLYGLVNTFAETKLKETQFMIIPYNSIYKLTTNKDAKMVCLYFIVI